MSHSFAPRRGVSLAIAALASLLVAGVVAQLFLAGAALFVGPRYWEPHRLVGHGFEPVVLVIVLLSLVGRQPAAVRRRALALVALLVAQVAMANIRGFVGAVHPVNAVVILGVSATLARAARDTARDTARDATHDTARDGIT